MEIHRFSDDEVRTEEFIRFGRNHYRGDDNWIAPFDAALREQLSPSYRFAMKPGNHVRHFLASSGNRTVGRISAMVNADLHSGDTAVGTIGFFESVDDRTVAGRLFDAACGWLRDTHGLTSAWGPMNFDIWHHYRLMTRGFDRKPFYGEPYNKDFYPALFTSCGWRPVRTWESVEVSGERAIEQVLAWSTPRYEEFLRRDYTFETFDSRRFDSELERLYHALTASYAGFFAFTPITFGEFASQFSRLRPAMDPRWITFACSAEEELAGFAGAFLDLSDAIRSMRGRTDLLARLRFAVQRRRADRVVFYIVGVSPEEAARQNGLGGSLVRHVLGTCYEQGFRSLVGALMPKDGRSRGLAGGRGAMEAQREYSLYEMDL
ncbi:MAG: hypothetical protein JJE01_01050 [Gemmatimonadetes bacterium]|nr:hypothetical protein [Gemmatimonadota bacterium]